MNTADQARQLWCPMVRIARREVPDPVKREEDVTPADVTVVGGCNTDALGRIRVPQSCKCIADQCAMWRWAEPTPALREAKEWWPEEDYPEQEPARPVGVPADAVWLPLSGEGDTLEGGYWHEPLEAVKVDNDRAAASRRGYCGLAGRPEMTE